MRLEVIVRALFVILKISISAWANEKDEEESIVVVVTISAAYFRITAATLSPSAFNNVRPQATNNFPSVSFRRSFSIQRCGRRMMVEYLNRRLREVFISKIEGKKKNITNRVFYIAVIKLKTFWFRKMEMV